MARKVAAPTGSIVKGYIETATIVAVEIEDQIAEALGSDLSTLEKRMALVGSIAPAIAKLSYFVRETADLCEDGPIEEQANRVASAMDQTREFYVLAIRAENSAQFARHYGQMLISISGLRSELQKLEKARFENSRMRRG